MHENSFCADPACAQGACECRGGVLGPDYHNRLASGFSVGVPGVPAAVDRMLKERGTFSLARATAPAIARARSGFPMYEHLHEKIVSSAVRLQHFPASVELFLQEDKKTPRVAVGETFTNPDLAATLERLAREGVEDFYKGELADELVAAVQAAVNPNTGRGGIMTKEDLRGYRAVWRPPVLTSYRGFQVYGMGPPSGGAATVSEALNLLEGLDLKQLRHNSADYLETIRDAMNLAWADRDTYMADPDFVRMPLRYKTDAQCAAFTSAETCPTGCAWDTLDGGATPAAPLASVSSHAAGQAWAGEGQGGGCSGLGMSSKAYARARRAVMGGPHGGRVPVHFLKSALDSDILRILGALTPTLSPTDPVPRAY